MAESACLMHSFSYDSGVSNEPHTQGNHGYALGESVSFGRFTSESLSWEKWSTFSHKRYVEEAKSYAQPGSVAQKKAFFEAHYKRIAAEKAAAAAALLEQEKATATSPKHQVEDRVCDTNKSTHDSETTVLNSHDSPTRISNSLVSTTVIEYHDSQVEVLKSPDLQTTLLKSQMSINEEQQIVTQDANSTVNLVSMETDKNVAPANPENTKSSNYNENIEDHVSVSVDSRTSQMERPLLKSKLNIDQEVTQPISKRKPSMSSLRSSIGKKSSRIPPSPAKYISSVHPRKDFILTPRTKNSTTMDSIDKRKSTQKSLYTLMNSSSVKEPFKLTSPAVRKIESTKPPPSVHTTPKRCATPMKTQTKASINGLNKQPLSTPSSVNTRMETPLHPSAAGSKTTGPKWHILSAVSKSLSAYRNKLQSPTISSPFVLRTEERATRRKQKLEEKFNEKQAQKVQPQTKLKEKAETEFRRLRQSFCFKARPLPEFYKERETPKKQIKKTLEANPKSLTPGRKHTSIISRPTSTSTTKNKSSRRLWKINDQNPSHHPLSSLAGKISHENMSPNIQH